MKDLLENVFKPKTKQEQILEAQEAERQLDLSAAIAKRCLENEDFKLYRETYLKAEDKMVDAMIIYTQGFIQGNKGDISNYALTMMRFVTRLQEIRTLLHDVKNTSARGAKE